MKVQYPAMLCAKGSDPAGMPLQDDFLCLVVDEQLCVHTELAHSGRFRSIHDLRFKSTEVMKAWVILSDGRTGWVKCDHLLPVDDIYSRENR